MADHIRTRNAGGTWVVRADGAVIGESTGALELSEGDYPPVIYFPREDIAMAFLERSDKATTCPWKGQAAYYSLHAESGLIENAVWSYETPKDDLSEIAGHLAFDTGRVTVERL